MQACSWGRGEKERREADGREVEGAHTAGCMHGPKLLHNQSEAKERMELRDADVGLTHDGSQQGDVGETAVHRLVRGILQKVITWKEDHPRLEFSLLAWVPGP